MPTVNLGRVRPIYKGTYSAGAVYMPLDFVKYLGITYFCILPSTGNTPTDGTYWQALASNALAEIGVTATAAELNVMDGIAASTSELNLSQGLTSLLRLQVQQPGDVFFTASRSVPAGSLKSNGAAVLRSSYTALDAAIYCGDAFNATALYGYRAASNVSPSTTRAVSGPYLVLPDIRGEFLRGWDDSRGIDSGRAIGTAQSDLLAAHQHTLTILAGTGGSIGGYAAYTGSGTAKYIAESAGGVETRPRNIALMACIKY